MDISLPDAPRTPVIERIETGLSPEDVFKIFENSPYSSMLNSSLKTDAGRYSFIGTEPFLLLASKEDEAALKYGGKVHGFECDPFELLSAILGAYRIKNSDGLPFTAGGIGYFGYDLKNLLEDLPSNAKDDLGLPDMHFAFYRALLIWDKKDPGKITISVMDKDPKLLMNKIKGALRTPPCPLPLAPCPKRPQFKSNFTKAAYLKAIRKVLEHIKAGNIYQACLSQRFVSEWGRDPYDLYRRLNKISPAPFSSYLNLKTANILSSSPELFLKVADGTVETRPMKGTRPRGKTKIEDREQRAELELSEKDKAELAMIVDLERNDLGKVCLPGSIKVEESRRIEEYASVFQGISVIKGTLREDASLVDTVKAAFPGGSISGCPKIRALEIIDELEPTARGIYTGGIGYLSFHDTMELSVAIRTMVHKSGKVYFQSGGGIVADSDPKKEYEETLVKAKAMMEALGDREM